MLMGVLGLMASNALTTPAMSNASSAPPLALPALRQADVAATVQAQPTATISLTSSGSRPAVKAMLYRAGVEQGVNPALVMGVAWWESGWDQSQVSSTGAVGIMQVEPATADTAGPLLLHRHADLHDAAANIELGTAVLKENLSRYHNNLVDALVAYYAGPSAVGRWADLAPDAQRYVWGVYRLALAFSQGKGPA
jgi:soluble lytic murein transglycosylase-like protein